MQAAEVNRHLTAQSRTGETNAVNIYFTLKSRCTQDVFFKSFSFIPVWDFKKRNKKSSKQISKNRCPVCKFRTIKWFAPNRKNKLMSKNLFLIKHSELHNFIHALKSKEQWHFAENWLMSRHWFCACLSLTVNITCVMYHLCNNEKPGLTLKLPGWAQILLHSAGMGYLRCVLLCVQLLSKTSFSN